VTNESGNYDFPSLQPGTYVLSATLPGFQTATFSNVQLGQGQQVRLNFTLQVGQITTGVDVTIAADTLLAATSASVGNVLSENVVRDLPLASRNVLDLVGTTPGVVTTINAFGAPVFSFGGTPFSQVNTTRDGLTTNDGRYNNSNGAYSAVYTSPDMVEEIRVTANNIDPALGRGSAQVQLRTRAGGNAFHGAVFYTNNNSYFTTQTWFQNLTGAPKSYTNRNQFGGRLGGPIIRNKAFFFVLIDDQRFLQKEDFLATVLTEPARQGNFRFLTEGAPGSAGGVARRNTNAFGLTPSVDITGKTLTATATGTPLFLNSFNLFSDVRDPRRTRIDPVWYGPQYLTRMPLPNDWTTGDGLNTAGFRWRRPIEGQDGATGQSQNTNRNHLTARVDYQLSTNNKITFTMSREKDWGVTGQTGQPDFPQGAFGDVRRVPDFYTASWTSTLSSSVLNEFRFGLKRDTWQGTSPLDKGCCWNGKGQDDLVDSASEMRASFPTVGGKFVYVGAGTGTGAYAPFGVASPRQSISPFQQWSDTLSFTMGAHSFQAGGEINFASSHQFNHGGQQTTRPNVTLGAGAFPVSLITTTAFRGIQANDVTLAQTMLATMSGTVASIQQQYFVNSPTATDWSDYRTNFIFERDLHENDWDLFFKDTWKVSSNLTLNLGIRYDKYGVPYDTTGLGGRFTGGQSALFGCSGKDFSVWWTPGAGNCTANTTALTTTEFVGKHSPNPDKTFWGNDWNNIAPSFGFSYTVPWIKRSTVVRGGYGINYAGAADYLSYSGNIGNLPGQTLNITYNPPSSAYLDLSGLGTANVIPVATGTTKPFTPVPLTNRTAGITGYADNRVTPYVQSFNLSVQHELARNMTVDVSWIGNKATKLFSGIQLNDTNVIENGLLNAFLTTRAGGDAPLFNQIFNGLNFGGAIGTVNGTSLTGSRALRLFTTTNAFIANGDVGALANYINSTNQLTTLGNGGLLRNGGLPENFIVVNPQFGSVTLQGNNSQSTYHSFQTAFTRRMTNGLYSQFSYTFSKALGDTGTRDPRNRRLGKGIVDIDRTHIVKANGTYALPFGPNRRFLSNAPSAVRKIVEGWEVTSIFSFVSGATLGFTGVNTLTQRATNTADLAGDLPADLGKVEKGDRIVQYFSGLSVKSAAQCVQQGLACGYPTFGADRAVLEGRFTNQFVVDASGRTILQNPQPGTTGNLSANIPGLTGPSNLGLDVSLSKKIAIDESRTLEFRADAVNALNKPVWGNPNTNINSANFGRITTATGARTITFTARLDF
jgi:hypothetical protein